MWRTSLRIGLCLGMAFATPALCGPDYAGGISGNDVQRLIIAALKAAGRPAVGVAAPLRGYPGCDGTPQVSAHRGDWGTVDLTCPAPHWVRALRLQGAQAGGWSVDGG